MGLRCFSIYVISFLVSGSNMQKGRFVWSLRIDEADELGGSCGIGGSSLFSVDVFSLRSKVTLLLMFGVGELVCGSSSRLGLLRIVTRTRVLRRAWADDL